MKNKYISFISLALLISLSSCTAKIPSKVIFNSLQITDLEVHTDLQKEFIEAENPDKFVDDHRYELGEKLSKPLPIKLTYKINTDNGAEADSYNILISENEQFDEYVTYFAGASSAYIYNLKFNTTYYYKVKANYSGKSFTSEINSFVTNDGTLRNIYADGVENIRDLGGYLLENGKTLRQGMIYRSAQFNYDKTKESTIVSKPTSKGLNTLLKQLKIKSDIDVREKENAKGEDETVGIKSSPLGNSVTYKYLPMRYGGGNPLVNSFNKESLEGFFNFLADDTNYPIDFHCIRGTDRTGALAVAILGLMGVSELDIQKDYLFSDFSPIGTLVRKNTSGSAYYILDGINAMQQDSMRENTIKYLQQYIEVTTETFNKIIAILES